MKINYNTSRTKELLFLEGPAILEISSTTEFSLYSYDYRFDKKGNRDGIFHIRVKNATSNNKVQFKVEDENGRTISDEIYISEEKNIKLPFKFSGNENFFNLKTKALNANSEIELMRLEIEFV